MAGLGAQPRFFDERVEMDVYYVHDWSICS